MTQAGDIEGRPSPMRDAIPVLINRAGGAASANAATLADDVTKAFADVSLKIDLQLLDARDMPAAVARVTDREIVVVGGGDGTLCCAAQVLFGHGSTALGILPLGTRNHLARQLGVPMDLPAAARLIADGGTRTIDIGRVNDRVFVNNASVGLYPSLVRHRDAQRRRHGVPKWIAAIPAAIAVLARIRHHRMRLESADENREITTPMLFVGNNRYTLDTGKIGQRQALDDGLLSVFAVASRRRRALIGFALRALIGRADPDRDFAAVGDVARLVVNGRSRTIDIALDGEIAHLAMPLVFTIDAGALRVIAPPLEHPGHLA